MRGAVVAVLCLLTACGRVPAADQDAPTTPFRLGIEVMNAEDYRGLVTPTACLFFEDEGQTAPIAVIAPSKLYFRRDGKVIALDRLEDADRVEANRDQRFYTSESYNARTIETELEGPDGRANLGVNIHSVAEDRVLLSDYGWLACGNADQNRARNVR